jgi:DNA polymerase-3 subunit gamma/tau
VGREQAAKHLEYIAKNEGIKIDQDALELLAEHGNGSFRDSIGLLDQLSNIGKPITAETVRTTLGIPPQAAIEKLLSYISAGDSQGCIQVLSHLREQGVSANAVATGLSAILREQITKMPTDTWVINLLKQLLEVSVSTQPQDYLEVCVLEASSSRGYAYPEEAPPSKPSAKPPEKEKKQGNKPLKSASTTTVHPFVMEDWPKIVDTVKTEAASIYTALRLAEPHIDNETLTLAFQFPLHQMKMNSAKSKDLLGRVIEETTGSKPKIECIVDKSITPAVVKKVQVDGDDVLPVSGPMANISNIFGGAEVLES